VFLDLTKAFRRRRGQLAVRCDLPTYDLRFIALKTSLTAAHCSKTLILASSSGSPMLRQCARLLIPGLVEFIAKMVPSVHDETVSESQAASIGEVWKAFAALFTSTSEPLSEKYDPTEE